MQNSWTMNLKLNNVSGFEGQPEIVASNGDKQIQVGENKYLSG